MDAEFLVFVVVGFVAQLIDGALGMAFGVVSATVLLTFGFSPAHASAIVHPLKFSRRARRLPLMPSTETLIGCLSFSWPWRGQ
jgi:hypothetical protein